MEDKFPAYMNGEEQFSEQDAGILVREHFGEPTVIEELPQDVHGLAIKKSPRLVAAIGRINVDFGITDLPLSVYGIIAGLLIIQNAVNLIGCDNLLARPYLPVLIHFILLSGPACCWHRVSASCAANHRAECSPLCVPFICLQRLGILMMLFIGPAVNHGLANVPEEFGITLFGMAIALVFFTDKPKKDV